MSPNSFVPDQNRAMKSNGTETEKKPSLISEIFSQITDHFDLLALESRYEMECVGKRVAAVAIASVLGITAFTLLQIAIVYGLVKAGLSLGVSCLILAVVYGVVAAVVMLKMGKRDARAGEPFEATQRTIKESLQWIQQVFS
jgi:hypothetical protein